MNSKTRQKQNQTVARPAANQIRWYKQFAFTDWLKIIGGILLFFSWYADKTESDWSSERDKLMRSQLVIDMLEMERCNYEIALALELKKSPIDSLQVALSKQRLSRVYFDYLTQSIGRVLDKNEKSLYYDSQYVNMVRYKEIFDATNRENLRQQNYRSIDSAFDKVVDSFSSQFDNLRTAFREKYWYVDKTEAGYKKLFHALYWLGSLALGYGFIVGKLRGEKKSES